MKKEAINSIANTLNDTNTDYFYVSSFDHFLCEYVPTGDSLRIFISGFTGSVAECLISKKGDLILFVDGRYHEQADIECPEAVVVKVPFGTSLSSAVQEFVGEKGRMSILPKRTPKVFMELLKGWDFEDRDEVELFSQISFQPEGFKGDVFKVDESFSSCSLKERVQGLLNDGEAAFINALDTLAWISGYRGTYLPYQGTFRGLGFATKSGIHLFTQDHELIEPDKDDFLKVYPAEKISDVLSSLKNQEKINRVWWDPNFTTAFNYNLLASIFDEENVEKHQGFHASWQALKDKGEIKAFESSFEKSDEAIYNGLCRLIEKLRGAEEVSELEFKEMMEESYKEQGALLQSFRTIAGFGPSGSIIHYGSPSQEKKYKESDMVLCDSGAIYAEGFATDCTRTIVPMGSPREQEKKWYTLVLKGLLKIMMVSVPKGTEGKKLDSLARESLKAHGLNYGHGTGHGVGVNVHEAGFSLRPESTTPIHVGQVGSMEPGFYAPGVGGIRLENIMVVEEDSNNRKNVTFRSLVHIGFWIDLIDFSLLEKEELSFLKAYEVECAKRGRSFAKFCSSQIP